MSRGLGDVYKRQEPVKRVLCNGEDVTAQVEKKDCLYLLELNGQNAVVEVE